MLMMFIACLVVLHISTVCEDICACNVTRMYLDCHMLLAGNCLTQICNKDVYDFTVHLKFICDCVYVNNEVVHCSTISLQP